MVLDNAAAAYATKSGIKGKFSKVKVCIERQSDTIESATHLVQDVGYTKHIVGTLTFLLQAFKQTSKVPEEVIERLRKKFGLPIEEYVVMYSAKSKVVEAAMSLYVTILKVIEVIGYYTKHIVIKGIKAAWDGEKHEESLLSCLEKITNGSKELMDEADTAHKQVTNKIAEDVEALPELVEEGLKQHLDTLSKDHIIAMEAKHEKQKQLLQHEIEKRDVISRGQDRPEQIMKSSQLREWLVQANSKELLVHGTCEPLPVSPISFFCAVSLQDLRGTERLKSVAFFCGCHPYDDYGRARTLIMSLLAQFLQQQRFDLSFIDYETAYWMDGGDT
ncbi:hypothetical protein O1611_g6360 [Lasiodiplodia mahajangana]|uniref:Uncharacterized protein n=1 Tax=Lasiodiplodia mahajangana TaxID=1108764 RepID=A0ACC2JIS8_9PEZI|nr:hypothetical protein O1611_g6360 [Lasiodiplodia mahajangana]